MTKAHLLNMISCRSEEGMVCNAWELSAEDLQLMTMGHPIMTSFQGATGVCKLTEKKSASAGRE